MAPVSNNIPQSQLLNPSLIPEKLQPARATVHSGSYHVLPICSERQKVPSRNPHYNGLRRALDSDPNNDDWWSCDLKTGTIHWSLWIYCTLCTGGGVGWSRCYGRPASPSPTASRQKTRAPASVTTQCFHHTETEKLTSRQQMTLPEGPFL